MILSAVPISPNDSALKMGINANDPALGPSLLRLAIQSNDVESIEEILHYG